MDLITKAQTLGLNIRPLPALGWNDDPQEHYLKVLMRFPTSNEFTTQKINTIVILSQKQSK